MTRVDFAGVGLLSESIRETLVSTTKPFSFKEIDEDIRARVSSTSSQHNRWWPSPPWSALKGKWVCSETGILLVSIRIPSISPHFRRYPWPTQSGCLFLRRCKGELQPSQPSCGGLGVIFLGGFQVRLSGFAFFIGLPPKKYAFIPNSCNRNRNWVPPNMCEAIDTRTFVFTIEYPSHQMVLQIGQPEQQLTSSSGLNMFTFCQDPLLIPFGGLRAGFGGFHGWGHSLSKISRRNLDEFRPAPCRRKG